LVTTPLYANSRARTLSLAGGRNSVRLERIQKILSDAGYQVLTANSAEEAEALADTEAVFDLIICSVVMELGGDTGVHLAEHIEYSKRTNSTLLVSHFAPELLRYVPGFSRQRHFMANPFCDEELLSRVRELLAVKG
jgi:CheY-like chemotaxis protein